MSNRPVTRSTRSNSITNNKSLAILGLRGNKENLARPPITGKAGLTMGGGLKDNSNKQNIIGGIKRKADTSMDNNIATKKRSVLGDVTNAIEKTISQGRKEVKKLTVQKKNTRASENVVKPTVSSLAKQVAVTKPVNAAPKTRSLAAAAGMLASVTALPKVAPLAVPETLDEDERELAEHLDYCDNLPSSQEIKLCLDSSSNYITASETSPVTTRPVNILGSVTEDFTHPPLPEGVLDYDKECEMDPFAVALYASDIFKYYQKREAQFAIGKYLDKQPEITESMRSILVDWMVEVQESFELNHETLYLAVKLVDLYLSKEVIAREQLQLVGSTALFIACKFDERTPPYIDDFLYICDDAYKRRELIQYEMKMLKTIGFDLGIPLSYRYLRRYARCAKVSMEELTLSRYILEMSLMEYDLIEASDSCLAAAALLLARCIAHPHEKNNWTPTLQHYSGFCVEDLYHFVHVLHTMLTQPSKDHLKTVRNKYSHEVFYEVAKIPVPENLNLG